MSVEKKISEYLFTKSLPIDILNKYNNVICCGILSKNISMVINIFKTVLKAYHKILKSPLFKKYKKNQEFVLFRNFKDARIFGRENYNTMPLINI